MRHLPPLLAIVLASACTPPPAASDEVDEGESFSIDEGIRLMFQEFENTERLPGIIEGWERVTKDIDYEGDFDQREFTVSPLPHDGLDITVPPETDPDDQTPAMVLGHSGFDLATNISTLLEPNQVCIESTSTRVYARTYTEGTPEAFAAGDIDVLRSTNEVFKDLTFASGWYDLFKDFRRVELEDGREAIVARSWIEEVFVGNGGTFFQTFALEVWLDDGDGEVDRTYALWGQLQIGILDGDDLINIVTSSLEGGYTRADQFIEWRADNAEAGDDVQPEYCAQDRDLDLERQ